MNFFEKAGRAGATIESSGTGKLIVPTFLRELEQKTSPAGNKIYRITQNFADTDTSGKTNLI